jgi:uncharacterized protein (TIGR00369 family)
MSNLTEHPLIRRYVEMNRFGRLLGMDFHIVAPGIVEYQLVVKEDHLATPVSAHGGVISALLDATLGVGALSAVCEEGKVVATVEMKVSFLMPVLLGDRLIATSEIIKKGKRILFVEASIRNQKDESVAKASGTLNAYPKDRAGY